MSPMKFVRFLGQGGCRPCHDHIRRVFHERHKHTADDGMVIHHGKTQPLIEWIGERRRRSSDWHVQAVRGRLFGGGLGDDAGGRTFE